MLTAEGGGCKDMFGSAVGVGWGGEMPVFPLPYSDEEEFGTEPGLRIGWGDERRGRMEGIHYN